MHVVFHIKMKHNSITDTAVSELSMQNALIDTTGPGSIHLFEEYIDHYYVHSNGLVFCNSSKNF